MTKGTLVPLKIGLQMPHDEGKGTMALELDHGLDNFASSVILCKSVILGDSFL